MKEFFQETSEGKRINTLYLPENTRETETILNHPLKQLFLPKGY